MRQALVFATVMVFGLSSASAGPSAPTPELRAAVACSKAALRDRALKSDDPPEAVAKAAFIQCLSLFQVVADQGTATSRKDPRSTALSRGIGFHLHMFGLFAGYLPLAVQTVESLRASSRS